MHTYQHLQIWTLSSFHPPSQLPPPHSRLQTICFKKQHPTTVKRGRSKQIDLALHSASKSMSNSYLWFGSIKEISSQFAKTWKHTDNLCFKHYYLIKTGIFLLAEILEIGTSKFLEVLKIKNRDSWQVWGLMGDGILVCVWWGGEGGLIHNWLNSPQNSLLIVAHNKNTHEVHEKRSICCCST